MNEEQRLFLVQARSAYTAYELLDAEPSLHHRHALHYLQMATELLGKASAWKDGSPGKTHKALVGFLRNLSSNSKAQQRLGYTGQNSNWRNTIRKLVPIAERLQKLAPALAEDGPSAEYPWPSDAPTETPAEYKFPLRDELKDTSDGRKLTSWLDLLFAEAEEYL